MNQYIYELFAAPTPEDEWATAYDLSEHPDAFPIAARVDKVIDRGAVIAHFGAWLEEHRLGKLADGAFTLDVEAADRYFEGRFTAFQQAIMALQELNEAQFIHDHNTVQNLIDDLCEAFAQKYSDYVLLGDDMIPVPLEEFLRAAQADTTYYFGAVLNYDY